ncbi:hypothetical protein CLV78_106213 [Aliiruegeria haliotis]|uniref:Uncharacterized protein n=1 Tax=Aliiruegeria haliotis TaxID=1280846 RepID=A0A2T0RNH4_9RHOB|nr:hypothetical protein CLV78_106213 [Aliiruegeria haliotis]
MTRRPGLHRAPTIRKGRCLQGLFQNGRALSRIGTRLWDFAAGIAGGRLAEGGRHGNGDPRGRASHAVGEQADQGRIASQPQVVNNDSAVPSSTAEAATRFATPYMLAKI